MAGPVVDAQGGEGIVTRGRIEAAIRSPALEAAHENSLQRIFPRLGQVDSSAAIIAALGRSA